MVLGKDKNSWSEVKVQVDPMTKDGRLKFFKNDKWKTKSIASQDRVSFSTKNFGRKATDRDSFPCKRKRTIEVKTNDGRYGYINYCRKPNLKIVNVTYNPSNIYHDLKKSTLNGQTYRYAYSPTNQMLFEKVFLKPEPKPFATNSNLLIKSDFKRFFTFHFDSSDINSFMESVRLGPMAAVAQVSFYLKLLVFKIKLALTTDVSFFEDSAYIPMVVYIPKEAKDYLNRKSGILYDWGRPKGSTLITDKIVKLNNDVIKSIEKGPKPLFDFTKKFCTKTTCDYQFGMNSPGGNGITMGFRLKRNLADKGFYPLLVENVSQFDEELDWERDIDSKKQHLGFYFETSGLEKGNHQWDFWLQFGKPQPSCPVPINLNKLR